MRMAVNRRTTARRHPATRALLGIPVLSILLPAGGCTVGPNYKPPKVEVPAQWLLPPEGAAATTQPSLTTTQHPSLAAWWHTFDDPTLDSLIRRAVEGNLDLGQATSRIR